MFDQTKRQDRGSLVHSRRLEDVEAITTSDDSRVQTKDDLRNLVEEPLLPACIIFFDKSIPTYATSANLGRDSACITLSFDDLTQENQIIAAELGGDITGHRGDRVVSFSLPFTAFSTWDEVEQWGIDLARRFIEQPPHPGWNMSEAERWYQKAGMGVNPGELSVEEILGHSFSPFKFYDTSTQRFFLDCDHCERVARFNAKSDDQGLTEISGPLGIKRDES